MTKRAKRILLIAGACAAGLVVVLVIASILILKSGWFANFAKDKIVAELEDATGGRAAIGSFEFDLSHLTIRIHNFVLHGTEPETVPPLLFVQLLELRMKLFSGIMHTLDLAYLGIEKPQVDLIVFPDGSTNIPHPKNPTKPSGNTDSLQTLINLKVNKFLLENGLIIAADQKGSFNARGENLRVLLNYDFAHPSYTGDLAMAPLQLTSSAKVPLQANVNIPVTIQSDAIKIQNASIATPESHIRLSASLANLNAPVISADMSAAISLTEIQRSVAPALDASARGAPHTLTAQLSVRMNETTKALQIETARVTLGRTTFAASGGLRPGQDSAVRFNADVALGELSRLFNVSSTQATGDLLADGTATLDARNNYSINGTLRSRGLAVRSGATEVSNVSLSSPFHADPYLISLDGLELDAFGGSLAAKLFVENMQQFSVEGSLRNFSLPVLGSALTGKRLGYDGTIGGALKAQGDLKAKGTNGYGADAHLAITPGSHGVPVSGRIHAHYAGATGTVALGESYVSLPNSRIDLAGSINHRIVLSLVSHNLNDFLPAVNFGSSTPETSLPFGLRAGGAAAVQAEVTGSLSDPRIAGHIGVTNFTAEQRPFNGFALDLTASPFGASVQNGSLTGQDLQTTFSARIGLWKWKPLPRSPLAANLTLRSNDLGSLLSLAGESSLQAQGQVAADVHLDGTYGNPTGNAILQVLNGSVDQQPFKKLYAGVSLGDQLITLSNVELDTAGGRITASGTFRHPRNSVMLGHAQFHIASIGVQLADITPLQQRSPGAAGTIQLSANAAADLTKTDGQTEVTVSDINADFAAHGLRVQNQSAGDLTGTARTNNGTVNYNLNSDFAGSVIRVAGRTALAKNYPTTADASIQNLSLSKALQITGQTQYPVSGNISANAHVGGTVQSPNASLSVIVSRANVYQEPINRLQGTIEYSNTRIQIPSIALDVPAGNVTLAGSFSHPTNNFNAGSLELKVKSSSIQLSKLQHVEQQEPGFTGTLTLAANLAASLQDHNGSREVRVSNLDADVAATALRLNQRDLGQATFAARTTGKSLNYHFDSNIAQSKIHAEGVSQLRGDYATRADLTFSNIRYSDIQPFLSTDSGPDQLFDATVAGRVSVNGPLLKVDDLAGRLQLNQLNVQTHPKASPTGGPALRKIDLQNQGPIVVTLEHGAVQVQQFKITGPDTSFTASGGINLNNGSNPLGLTLAASLNLGILQDIDREFYSSGLVALDATVRGNFSKPLVNGQVVLKGANVNYTQSPNGLSNANGIIQLNGTSATIQTLTAESGGGKIALTGFVAFGGPVLSYNLRASANKVRVRYSGIDVVSNSAINLIGNANRSLLGGTVALQRIAYNSTSDVGSILSSAATPPSTPSNPSTLLAGMRLNIHILTAPDLQVVSTFTDKLEIFADLTVRGTAAHPGILGRVHVTNGQLVFFGNTYTVNTGAINFYNPNSIEPVIDISLETIAQGVDVIMGVSGPMDDLKLSYRSDPPLTFEQIVQLLATNTTPANPQVAAHEPAPPQQSLSQMGESAVLGQAIANPLASRVQRVFGLTDFKIDPSVAGNNGQPSARITLQQKITSNITFTYIQDVTQSNSEIVRVQFDVTSKLSAVALRDYNGNVSLEFFYKFKRR